MMIRAYQEMYLNSAQSVLGNVFDYAINYLDIKGTDFVKMFVASSISKRMENGEPTYIAGKSGIEIAHEILLEIKGKEHIVKSYEQFHRSVEYWIGWAVCYYQWYSGRTYSEIFRALSFEELQKMYYPLHEADISKFVEIADARMKAYYSETNLKYIRTIYNLTQAELAEQSGVSLRSIQMYEQRNKNINKANAETLYRLARTLGCTMEDLIEK